MMDLTKTIFVKSKTLSLKILAKSLIILGVFAFEPFFNKFLNKITENY